MRLAEMKDGTERLSASPAAITQLTEAEQRYLQCLSARMTFQEMAVELGWTYHQVVEFGSHFLDKGFCFLRCLKSQYHAVENHMHKCDSVFMIP